MTRAPSQSAAMAQLRGQLRDFAIGAAVALVIATIAFVGVRNRELEVRQIAMAQLTASAPGDDGAALVGPALPSVKHPYLRHRKVLQHGAWRDLGTQPDDKLLYDAANRFEREGQIAELLPDGRGLVAVAGVGGTVVALSAPDRPAPYPWLVVIGVLGLGATFAASGVLVSRRGRYLGTFAGIAAVAVPALLWQSWIAAAAIFSIAAALAAAQHAELTDRVALGMREHRIALRFLAPAGISMLVLVAVPFVIGIAIGFYDHAHGKWTFVGLSNFGNILSGDGRTLDDPLNFWFILGVTVMWTVANVLLHVTIGVALALLLSRTWLRGKGVFRMLLILPWAVPNYITALIWHGMFRGQDGAINSILHVFGISDVSWFSSWASAFAANVTTNTWLGFPFMMVVALGALETIPKELYEAAAVDGASAWQRFRHITLPHLRPALGPAVALGAIWTFNMFNVIYLVSGGKPGDSTNILVTDAYRWAFERGNRYGMAAAEATLIFVILLVATRLARPKEAAS